MAKITSSGEWREEELITPSITTTTTTTTTTTARKGRTVKVKDWKVLVGNGLELSCRTFDAGESLGREFQVAPRTHCLFVHGLGLCKEVMEGCVHSFLLQRPWFRGACTTFDLRGHGASDREIQSEAGGNWWKYSTDILLLLRLLERDGWEVAGVGHSMGSALLLSCKVLGFNFSHLTLFEPIMFPFPPVINTNAPPALIAAKRVASFPSYEAVMTSYSQKKPFNLWDQSILRKYILASFHRTPPYPTIDGDAVGSGPISDIDSLSPSSAPTSPPAPSPGISHGPQLSPADWSESPVFIALPPLVEADLFVHGAYTGIFGLLEPATEASLNLVGGETSFWPSTLGKFVANKLQLKMHVLKGLSHFAPMEDPEAMAATIPQFRQPDAPVAQARL